MDYTLELSDSLEIQEETLERGGNNIRMSFDEVVPLSVSLDGAYKIKRAGDTAFIRTNYP